VQWPSFQLGFAGLLVFFRRLFLKKQATRIVFGTLLPELQ
jgi:hypothetical protein